MLSTFDADLARRDAQLPGLATILDPDALVELLQARFPSRHFESIAIRYLRYKHRTNCLASYDLNVDENPIRLYVKTHRTDAPEKLFKSRKRVAPEDPRLGEGILIWTNPPIVMFLFPNDAKLVALRHLFNGPKREQFFKQLLPDISSHSDFEVLRYKPERRLVAKLLLNGEPYASLKCYTETGYSAARLNTKAFNSRSFLRIPKTLARSNRLYWLAFEWMQGTILGEAIKGPGFDPSLLKGVGAALAELHTQKPNELRALSRETEIGKLMAQANNLSFLRPELAKKVRKLARQLAERFSETASFYYPIHGDFYANQILIGAGQVVILDLDEAVYGDPAADLGNFLAHVKCNALNSIPAMDAETLSGNFLEGYGEDLSNARRRLDLYTSAALFHLASEPFRLREREWHERMEHLIELAEVSLRRASADHEFRSSTVPVIDPFGIEQDPAMSSVSGALSPLEVQFQFGRNLPFPKIRLQRINVIRHKPGRRCLIEYEVDVERIPEKKEFLVFVGKARARGLNRSVYHLIESLYGAGFGEGAEDELSIPEPVGIIPAFHMYIQRKIAGIVATKILPLPAGIRLASRIAHLIHKLHASNVPAAKKHTLEDELENLKEKLELAAAIKPEFADRLKRLAKGCVELGGSLEISRETGIHRDFYPDQVLVQGDRLFLLDLDLYCQGDPSLDAGNFLGHLTELSLRLFGNEEGLRECGEAFKTRFVELSGESSRGACDVYELLTLARHIYLSTQYSDRTHLTEILLSLCERRLRERIEPFILQRNRS